jgi:hypothetical protein
MAEVCSFEYQSAIFFFISIEVHLYLVGLSFELVRMASVKQILVEPTLFAVGMGGWGGGGGEGMLSPCEAQSKQQQNKSFKWGERKKIKLLCSTNFQFLYLMSMDPFIVI